MATCPRCTTPLVSRLSDTGIVFGCPKCGGRNVALSVMRRAGATEPFLKEVLAKGHSRDARHRLRCPHCNRPMVEVALQSDAHELNLDYCTSCSAVWFDGGELESMPTVPPPPPPKELSAKAREQMAIFELQTRREEKEKVVGTPPPEWWKWLPGLIGLPVEYEAPALRSVPWLTWAIAGAVVLAFLMSMQNLEKVIEEWGFVPNLWYRHGGLTLLTAFFLHAGWLHLLSNTYFFLVFGDNVEDHLGRLFYVALLLGSDLAGNALHAMLDPHSSMPCVGASGGIAGVLAYYAVVFPDARVGFLWRFLWIQMPAIALLGIFLGIQLLGAWAQASGFSNVSYMAHLGGLGVGIAVGIADRLIRRPETKAPTA